MRHSLRVPEPTLTPQELLARAEAMRPRLLECQADTEERTYYSKETHAAFRDAGFYRTLQPRGFGGYEFAVLYVGERYMEYCRRGASGGVPFSREEDLRLHAVASHAGRLAWDAADLLARKAGSTAATRKGERMQRYLRDLLTYRTHHESTQFEAHATMLGRVRFGLPMWE